MLDLAERREVSESELSELLATMQPIIYRFASRRLGPSNGDEIVGEVFAAACISLRKGGQVTPAWLMTVTRNKVVDRWRHVERQRRLTDAVGAEEIRRGRSAGVIEDVVVPDDVHLVLAKIRPRYRRLLERRFFDGMSIGDIADAEKTTYKAVESALKRAKAAFRECSALDGSFAA